MHGDVGRLAVKPCPKCGEKALRRVYLQNAQGSPRPRHEPIEGWLYCDQCHKMSGGHVTPPRRRAKPS